MGNRVVSKRLMEIGERIRERRQTLRWSQEKLAEMVNITTSHLKHIESGHRKPSVEVLFQIMRILHVSLDALVFEDAMEIPAISTSGLTQEEIGVVSQLVELLRRKHESHP